jgi:hypothetical protein
MPVRLANPRDGDEGNTNHLLTFRLGLIGNPIALRAMIVKPLSNVRLWRENYDQKALTVVALGKSLKARATLGSRHMMDSPVAIKEKYGPQHDFFLNCR